MDWIVGLFLIGFVGWLIFRPKQPGPQFTPEPKAPAPPRYKNYQDALERKPIEELDDEEQIIRRAHDAFHAERSARTAEHRAKQDLLEADQKKIARATDFIKTSYLDIALPFLQEKTQHWPSWAKMDESRWKAPVPLSDLSAPENSSFDNGWVEFRADGGPVYRIAFEKSRMPADDDMEYGSMTLWVDGEEVLGMFVERNWTAEWDQWKFAVVESLKVGPWIEDFVCFYNCVRSIDENEPEDRNTDYVRQKASKIDFGGTA